MMRTIGLLIAALGLAACTSGGQPEPDGAPLTGAKDGDPAAAVQSDTQAIQGAIVRYYVHHSDYPAHLEDLVATSDPTSLGGYLESVPADPWGKAYVYRLDEAGCVVLSKGPDRVEGTADDIVNRWMAYTAR